MLGWAPLPGVATELDELAAALPAGTGFTRLDDARRDEVAAALRGPPTGLTWAHLACHAEQDLARPSRAAFLLADGRLGLTEVARGLRAPAAGAYLGGLPQRPRRSRPRRRGPAPGRGDAARRVPQGPSPRWALADRRARAAARRIYRTLCADGIFRPALVGRRRPRPDARPARPRSRHALAVGTVRAPRPVTVTPHRREDRNEPAPHRAGSSSGIGRVRVHDPGRPR